MLLAAYTVQQAAGGATDCNILSTTISWILSRRIWMAAPEVIVHTLLSQFHCLHTLQHQHKHPQWSCKSSQDSLAQDLLESMSETLHLKNLSMTQLQKNSGCAHVQLNFSAMHHSGVITVMHDSVMITTR